MAQKPSPDSAGFFNLLVTDKFVTDKFALRHLIDVQLLILMYFLHGALIIFRCIIKFAYPYLYTEKPASPRRNSKACGFYYFCVFSFSPINLR